MTDKHAPDSLKYQWRILGAVLRSNWATGLDKSVAFEIVDNYRKDHRNSRASLSYLMRATGSDRKSVIASTRRIVENGPFIVARQGVGTRPTEYEIDFDSVQDKPSSGADTTTSMSGSSGGVEPTTGSGVEPTTSAPSSGADTTESVLPVAAYKAGIQDRMIDFAAPMAPPLAGLSAATAEPAKEGFEELWKAYGHRQKKAEAKAAYTKLSPDGDLHVRLVRAATAWFTRWAEQNKPDAPRFTLAKWIEREEFECSPPAGYKAKSQAAAPAEVPAEEAPNFTIYPDRSTSGEIVRTEISTDEDDGARMLEVWYRTVDGAEINQLIVYESADPTEQDVGQKEIRGLLEAVDLLELEDANELVGRKVDLMITQHGKFVSCNRPWVSAPRHPRGVPRFVDVVANTPASGWSLKIGTAYDNEDLEKAA
jgi:hypothetical protein